MKELTEAGSYERFFEKLKEAPEGVLLLDYDGTLAPFRVKRNEAVPYEGVRELLRGILEETSSHVIIISGRHTDDLVPLLGVDPRPEIFGSHGWERLIPGHHAEIYALDEMVEAALENAQKWVTKQELEDRSETKPSSVTLHWRGLNSAEQQRLERSARDAWNHLVKNGDLELHEFDGGLEIRALGRNKGDAVEAVLAEAHPDAAVAYLGDDLTDEDAFEKLGERGLKVLVRKEWRETRADMWITPPEELLAFLERWKLTCKENS